MSGESRPAPQYVPKGLSFDDALVKYLGEFGNHQKKVLFLASLWWLPNALFILLMVFANKDPIKLHWWQCTDPADTACKAVFDEADPSKDFCSLSSSQYAWTKPTYSIISQFELTCKRAWLSQLVNSAFFLGYLFGSGIFGSLADQHGRKITLLIATAVATVFTFMSGFSSSYWVYFASRLLTGVGAAGQALVTYLIATESIGPKWRGVAGVGTQMFFVFGEFLLVLVAYLLPKWKAMCFCIVIMSVASFALFIIIPESPRWLLAKGRLKQAEAVMERIAHENGTRLPTEPMADPSAGQHEHVSLTSILKDRHICRRFFILAYVWCILCMTYYGISLALNGLKGSIYVTFMIAAAAELPSNILAAWSIERIGRHNSLAGGMLLGGVSCLICSFVPAGGIQAVFAAIGKFGCAGAFTIASIFTSELFPTLVRSAVLGAENEAARVGGIAAPFIVLLGTQLNNTTMPFLIFGCTSVFAGLLIFTLPETLGAPMPDTMKDMDNIASIFTTGAWKKGWKQTRSELFSIRAISSVPGSTQNLQNLQKISEEGGLTPRAVTPANGTHQGSSPLSTSPHLSQAGGAAGGLEVEIREIGPGSSAGHTGHHHGSGSGGGTTNGLSRNSTPHLEEEKQGLLASKHHSHQHH